ncbi:MAG: phage holin family protein [Candidatus Dormibacteraeota bacterium]|nr:phage holin family protein [Candidatus Dormibacteraeota bacterium]
MAIGIAMSLVAVVTLLFALIYALAGLPAAFSIPLFHNTWLGWVAFGGIFLVLALVFGLVGYRLLRGAVKEGKETGQQFKEDAEWLKGLTKRGSSES